MRPGDAWFGRVYDRRSRELEELGAADHRHSLVHGIRGRAIEIGAGNGLNFRHLPLSIDHFIAVEPNPYLRRRARAAAAVSPIVISVVAGAGTELPIENATMDAVVCSLVLCTVPSVQAVLTEIRRVLKPGGELRFYEHGASDDPRLLRWQVRAEPIWRLIAGGCRLTRDPVSAIVESGFTLQRQLHFEFRPRRSAALARPHVLGVATRVP